MYVSVQGGTFAGWRKVRPTNASDWRCSDCGARNRYYWLKCPNCGARRPEEDK